MTLYEISKPGVHFHDFSKPGKNNGIPRLFQVFHDWIHPAIILIILVQYRVSCSQHSDKAGGTEAASVVNLYYPAMMGD